MVFLKKDDLISRKSAEPATGSEPRAKSLFGPTRITLVVMGLVTTATMVLMLLNDVRSTEEYRIIPYALPVSCFVVLLWCLVRMGSFFHQQHEVCLQVEVTVICHHFSMWPAALENTVFELNETYPRRFR
jgi:hypothetical protein